MMGLPSASISGVRPPQKYMTLKVTLFPGEDGEMVLECCEHFCNFEYGFTYN